MQNIYRILGIVALFALGIVALGYATMYLWNWIMPHLFKLPVIDFYMAIGMVLLSKILFGGIHVKPQPIGQRKFWKAKWESMTPEEREQFKQEFAERFKKSGLFSGLRKKGE